MWPKMNKNWEKLLKNRYFVHFDTKKSIKILKFLKENSSHFNPDIESDEEEGIEEDDCEF